MAKSVEGPVWLGLAGDFTDGKVDHYSTKVGGLPVYPGAGLPRNHGHIKCGSCGSGLSLVLQVTDTATTALDCMGGNVARGVPFAWHESSPVACHPCCL